MASTDDDTVDLRVIRYNDTNANHGTHTIPKGIISFTVAVKSGAPTLNGVVLDPGDILEFSSFSARRFQEDQTLVTASNDDVLYTEVTY